MALKFAKNCLKNDNFSKLFPLREINHDMKKRNSDKYHINFSKTRRYKDSAIPYLQLLLNKDNYEKKNDLKRLIQGLESSQRKRRKIG